MRRWKRPSACYASWTSAANKAGRVPSIRDVLTVAEQTPLSEIADLLIRHRIRRVPVVRDGRLVGVVSRPDLLKHVLESEREPQRAAQ